MISNNQCNSPEMEDFNFCLFSFILFYLQLLVLSPLCMPILPEALFLSLFLYFSSRLQGLGDRINVLAKISVDQKRKQYITQTKTRDFQLSCIKAHQERTVEGVIWEIKQHCERHWIFEKLKLALEEAIIKKTILTQTNTQIKQYS